MKKQILVRHLIEEENGYRISLDLTTDSNELVDISYIVSELTKITAHIESELSIMSYSRKGVNRD